MFAPSITKVSRESLYDRISKCLINNKKYNEAAFPKEIRRYIPLNYNASTKIKAKELVTEIIARLEDIPDGCAECFPFELIDELKQEYLTDNSL